MYLIAAGILVQAPVVLLVANDSSRALPPGDPPGYLQLAESLLARGIYSTSGAPPFAPEIFRTPGYPIFLAGLLALGGHSLVIVAAAQSLLRILSGVFLARLAADWLGARTLGVAAGILWIVVPIPALYAGVAAPETLFAFLFLLTLLLLRRRTWRTAALSGFLLGIAVLVRPIGVVLVFLLLPAAGGCGGRTVQRALCMAAFLCAAGLALAPWLARNELAFGKPALSSVGGVNLLEYNAASCLGKRNGESWESGVAQAEQRYRDYLDANHLQPTNPIQESDAMTVVAAGIYAETPAQCAFNSLVDGWNSLRPGASYAMLFLRPGFPDVSLRSGEYSPAMADLGDPLVLAVSVFLTVWCAALYLSASAGALTLLFRRQWDVICFWLLPMAILLMAPGMAGNARFRIPVDPGLALLAVAGIARGWSLLRKKKSE